MFSGIVAEVGSVVQVGDGTIQVATGRVLERTPIGGSVAVNGVCLTATAVEDGMFRADVMPETLRRTTLGGLRPGDRVNLESALGFGDEVGGHLVQGHVDACGEVVEVRPDGNAAWVVVRVPEEVLRHCVVKGSIAIDGASITIAEVGRDSFAVSLIPHTLEATVASGYRPGSRVNIEVDVLAKYVDRYVSERQAQRSGTGAMARSREGR